MERLLDEVLVGQQEMVGAIDAVCAQASRIIGRLQEGAGSVDARLLGGVARPAGPDRPPTPAMKGFVDSLARQKGLKPPRRYTTSGAACRAFLDQHAPKKDGAQAPADVGVGRPPPVRKAVANKRRPDQPAADAPATQIMPELGERRSKPGRKAGVRERKAGAGKLRTTRSAKAAPKLRSPNAPDGDTPLRIPFGNKEAALQLGARYRAGGWYAPAGADLAAFRERGWL
jgi:DNA topoisomerase-3